MNLAALRSPGRAAFARLLRRYLAPRWRSLCGAGLSAAAVAALSGLLLRVFKPAIDELIVHPAAGALWRLPLTIMALALGRALAQSIQAVLVNQIGARLVGDIQVDLFRRTVRADLARLTASHSGAFISSVLYDAGLVRDSATLGLVNSLQQALTLLAAAAVMAWSDWRLAVFFVVAAPLVLAVLRRFSRLASRAARKAMAATSVLSAALLESLDGIRIIKMENREAYEEARLAAVVSRRQGHVLSGDNARALAAPVSESLMTTVVAAILVYEGWRSLHGARDIGAAAAFFAALLASAQALRQLANLSTLLSQGAAASERLIASLDAPLERRDRPGATHLPGGIETVRLEKVAFAYDAERPVLDGVDMAARRGEVVALVGPSGAGKTTILNLIPRLYDVTGGRVTIDGRDTRGFTLVSLRRQIALVTQEPFLFDDTIGANIAYGLPEAQPEQVVAAARAAAADEFIAELPLAYDTPVGEAGVRLSGGQRQRIALARAFLKDAPILLLDEATSALDSESEILIQAALKRLMVGRVTILIAHRLSTVREAQRIYVLDRGRIIEHGDHSELIVREGLYSRMAGAQNLDRAPGAE